MSDVWSSERDPDKAYVDVVQDADLGTIVSATHPDGTVVTAADPGPTFADWRIPLAESLESDGDELGAAVRQCIEAYPRDARCDVCASLYEFEFDEPPPGWSAGMPETDE